MGDLKYLFIFGIWPECGCLAWGPGAVVANWIDRGVIIEFGLFGA